MGIDLRTALLAGFLILCVLGITFTRLAREYGHRFPGLGRFACAYITMAFGQALIMGRDILSPWISILMGNLFFAGGMILQLSAIRIRAAKKKRGTFFFLGLLGAYGAFYWYFGLYRPLPIARYLASSLFFFLILIADAWISYDCTRNGTCPRPFRRLAPPFLVIALIFAIRFVVILLLGNNTEWMRGPTWDGLFTLLTGVLLAAVGFSIQGGIDGTLADELSKSIEEKDLLLKELHHRTKNELTMMSSLVSLQGDTLHDSVAKDAFRALNGRLRSIASLHEHLYKHDTSETAAYLKSIVYRTHRNAMLDAPIRLEEQLEEIEVPERDLVPLGLVLNELLTNSIKHGFVGRTEGRILVKFRVTEDGGYELEVEDDGVGMKAAPNGEDHETLGIILVRTLASQLQGTVAFVSPANGRGDGTRITLKVPNRKQAKR